MSSCRLVRSFLFKTTKRPSFSEIPNCVDIWTLDLCLLKIIKMGGKTFVGYFFSIFKLKIKSKVFRQIFPQNFLFLDTKNLFNTCYIIHKNNVEKKLPQNT